MGVRHPVGKCTAVHAISGSAPSPYQPCTFLKRSLVYSDRHPNTATVTNPPLWGRMLWKHFAVCRMKGYTSEVERKVICYRLEF